MRLFRLLLGIVLFALAASAGTILIDPHAVAPPSSITANTAVFDGTDELEITHLGTVAGITDPVTELTLAFWIKRTSDSYNRTYLYFGTTGGTVSMVFYIDTSDRVAFYGHGSTTFVAQGYSSSTIESTDGWVHVMITMDLPSDEKHVYINGTEDASFTWTNFKTGETLDLLPTSSGCIQVGAQGGSNYVDASLAELWFDDDYHNDVSKFYSGGDTMDLGSTGNLVTGNQPAIYLSRLGDGDDWAQNSGKAGDFTLTGTLGTTTPP